jgi:type VI secretion system protein VasD
MFVNAHVSHEVATPMTWLWRSTMAMLLPLLLAACSSTGGDAKPAQKEQAKLDISIAAARDLNVDHQGRGAPMLLRVYELKTDTAFQEADFFALQNADKAALGADLLAVDQFIMRPGETREIKRKAHPETTAIGIFAGYRNLPTSTWRMLHKMPPAADQGLLRMVMPANKAKLQVNLQSNAIVLIDEQQGKRPTQFANESIKALENSRDDIKAVEQAPLGMGEALKKRLAP